MFQANTLKISSCLENINNVEESRVINNVLFTIIQNIILRKDALDNRHVKRTLINISQQLELAKLYVYRKDDDIYKLILHWGSNPVYKKEKVSSLGYYDSRKEYLKFYNDFVNNNMYINDVSSLSVVWVPFQETKGFIGFERYQEQSPLKSPELLLSTYKLISEVSDLVFDILIQKQEFNNILSQAITEQAEYNKQLDESLEAFNRVLSRKNNSRDRDSSLVVV